jgi:hypothetical protein
LAPRRPGLRSQTTCRNIRNIACQAERPLSGIYARRRGSISRRGTRRKTGSAGAEPHGRLSD